LVATVNAAAAALRMLKRWLKYSNTRFCCVCGFREWRMNNE
jgi:hypothetical protein